MKSKGLFKACRNCKALVYPDQQTCPLCGSSSFSEEWTGMMIILSIDSEIGSIAKVEKPWRYALMVK